MGAPSDDIADATKFMFEIAIFPPIPRKDELTDAIFAALKSANEVAVTKVLNEQGFGSSAVVLCGARADVLWEKSQDHPDNDEGPDDT